eukprot:14598535-Heterocapsa_arctica.AAC.1
MSLELAIEKPGRARSLLNRSPITFLLVSWSRCTCSPGCADRRTYMRSGRDWVRSREDYDLQLASKHNLLDD